MNNLARLQAALTSTYHSFVYRSIEECPACVVQALKKELPHLDPLSWKERLTLGGVFINGKPVSEDSQLSAPCKLEYFEPKYDLQEIEAIYPPFSSRQILYEDEDLLVVFKPYRLPCLPTREQRKYNLKAQLEEYLRCKCAESSLHLPSRLDTSVCGLVIASKSARSHAIVQRIYENRTARKLYILQVVGSPPWSENLCEFSIAKDPQHPILRRSAVGEGKPAQTKFSVVCSQLTDLAGRSEPVQTSILMAQPLTGRTHQIRVHAQSLGYPIIGDNFYGGAAAPELRLLSFGAAFSHPISAAPLQFELPPQFWPVWLNSAHDFNLRSAVIR